MQPSYTAEASPLTDAQLVQGEDRRRSEGLWWWSLVDGLIAFALILVLSVPLVGYFLYADGVFNNSLGSVEFESALNTSVQALQTDPSRFFAAFLLQSLGLVAITVLRVKVFRGLPLHWLGLHGERFGRNLVFGLLLGVLVFAANFVLSWAFERLGQRSNQSDLFPIIQGDPGGQTLVFLAGAILAPIVEEIFFRGYVFNAWLRRWGAPVAYVVSALIFAVPHLAGITQGEVSLVVTIFVIGLLFAWGLHRSRSLVPAIVAHAMNNGISMAAFIYCTNNPNSGAC